VPLAGIAIAWALYRNGFWQTGRAPGKLALLLRAGGGFDALYDATLVQPYLRLVEAWRHDPVDWLSTALERAATALHRQLRATQNGKLRRYAAWMMAGSIATIAMVLFA
jgi:NADH-quinone oxidoreductase subunit L